jgi:hypothetical protein
MSAHGYRVDRPRRSHHFLRIPTGARRLRLVLQASLGLHDLLEARSRGAGRFGAPIWRCSCPLTHRTTGRDVFALKPNETARHEEVHDEHAEPKEAGRQAG